MTEVKKESSKITLKKIVNNFKKSKRTLKVGLVANALSVLACILTLLGIFSLFSVIAFGVFTVISLIAYGVLLADKLSHRAD